MAIENRFSNSNNDVGVVAQILCFSLRRTRLMKKVVVFSVIFVLSNCTCDKNIIPNTASEYKESSLKKDGTYYTESSHPNYLDNVIYKNCKEIVFEYSYEKGNIEKYYTSPDFGQWNFITKEELIEGQGVKFIKLKSTNPSPNYQEIDQSSITYEYLNKDKEILASSETGVVENSKNIVIHNPRGGFFLALFSFPWPAVKFPIIENTSWNWEFSYGDLYKDERFFTWQGSGKMSYSYKYVGEEVIAMDFGSIITSKFEAIGVSESIENRLTYYFNSKYGFVKQVFLTSDGAKIELIAVDIVDNCF